MLKTLALQTLFALILTAPSTPTLADSANLQPQRVATKVKLYEDIAPTLYKALCPLALRSMANEYTNHMKGLEFRVVEETFSKNDGQKRTFWNDRRDGDFNRLPPQIQTFFLELVGLRTWTLPKALATAVQSESISPAQFANLNRYMNAEKIVFELPVRSALYGTVIKLRRFVLADKPGRTEINQDKSIVWTMPEWTLKEVDTIEVHPFVMHYDGVRHTDHHDQIYLETTIEKLDENVRKEILSYDFLEEVTGSEWKETDHDLAILDSGDRLLEVRDIFKKQESEQKVGYILLKKFTSASGGPTKTYAFRFSPTGERLPHHSYVRLGKYYDGEPFQLIDSSSVGQ